MIGKTHPVHIRLFKKYHTLPHPHTPHQEKKYLKRVEEQFQPPQNEVSHRVLVYIAEGCHHEVHREDDVIHAKQRDQNECGFSQASAKPRTRER